MLFRSRKGFSKVKISRFNDNEAKSNRIIYFLKEEYSLFFSDFIFKAYSRSNESIATYLIA